MPILKKLKGSLIVIAQVDPTLLVNVDQVFYVESDAECQQLKFELHTKRESQRVIIVAEQKGSVVLTYPPYT